MNFKIVLEKSLTQAVEPSSSLREHVQIDCFLREAILKFIEPWT